MGGGRGVRESSSTYKRQNLRGKVLMAGENQLEEKNGEGEQREEGGQEMNERGRTEESGGGWGEGDGRRVRRGRGGGSGGEAREGEMGIQGERGSVAWGKRKSVDKIKGEVG